MKKIILLEDEEALGAIYKKKLDTAGYEVLWFRTTSEVEEAVKNFKADLVILDYGIRGEDHSGLDIVPNLKKLLPHARILMLSNYSHFHLGEKAKDAGVDEYLVKIDTSPRVLIAHVKKLLT